MGRGTYVAAENQVVLRVLDNLLDLLDGAVDFAAGTADEDDVLGGRVPNLGTDLDGEAVLVTDDAANPPSIRRSDTHEKKNGRTR